MAQDSGSITTAHGATGVLKALTDFLVAAGGPGRNWTLEVDQNAKDDVDADAHGAECREVVLKNTGTSGNDLVLVGIREWKYPTNNAYGWELNGYLTTPATWNANKTLHNLNAYDATWEHWTELPVIQLVDSNMDYWFVADENRIMGIVKVSGDYFCFYIGNGVRLGNPGDYPYPLFIAGSSIGNVNAADGGYGPVRPHASSTSFFLIDPANNYITKDSSPLPKVYPQQGVTLATAIGLSPDSKGFFFPVFVVHDDAALFQLQNMYGANILSMQSEDQYTISKQPHKVFQQAEGVSQYNFLGVKWPGTTTTT